MLRGIHKASSNLIGRVLMAIILGLIAVSFAVWGIGDIFRGFGQSTLAKIGGTEIGIEQFRQTYNDRLQQLIRRIGRPISPEQARALGLHRQLLGQILAEAALDENARRLHLALSNTEIAKRIMADPNFRGPTGQFDRAYFEQVIRQAGYIESRYVAEQRRVSLRRQIAESVTGSFTVPTVALELQHRYANEERSVEYSTLGPAQAGDIPAPSADELTKYFQTNKAVFRAPEYRKLAVLALTPESIARWIEISDEDARKAYQDRRARYVTAERREVQQIVFPNAEEARAAVERLAGSMSFTQLASERGLKDADTNLGLVVKSSIVDPAVAQAAFSLKSGEVSKPIAGRFGSVLVQVGKIEPEKVRAFDEVAGDIKHELAIERAKTQLTTQYDKIEDERGAGAPLTEISEKLKLATRMITAIDRAGRDPTGAPVADLPQGVDLLTAAFASDVGAENDPLRIPTGGYVWYEILAVTPSRERALDEVKDMVIERWRTEEIATRLKARAIELVDKLKTATISEVATAAGLTPQTASHVKRGQPPAEIPRTALEDVFRAPKGAAGNTEGARPTERFVFRVTDVSVPKLAAASPEGKQIAEALRAVYGEELLAQYVTQIETDLGVTINEAALNQILGVGTN